MACTNDWTKNTATVEFPALQSIYRLYGAEDKVSFLVQEANHNYNRASRESAYQFFGKHFLGESDPEKLREKPFTWRPTTICWPCRTSVRRGGPLVRPLSCARSRGRR